MALNPLIAEPPDSSVAEALAEALKAPKDHGAISYQEVAKIIEAASDEGVVTDVEFRDIKSILRTQPLWGPSRRVLEAFLQLNYPLDGPFVLFECEKLEGTKKRGSGSCAALVQTTLPTGKVATWREGIPVRGNGHLIKTGTAVATFEDGIYPNRDYDNHVAYYLSQNDKGIVVMDQWEAATKVRSRTMTFKGKKGDGYYMDPSNNGDALSVVMKKKETTA